MARRDTHTRHISSRFPSQPSKDTSWVNPSLPPGASRLAQPKGSLRQPRSLFPTENEWLLLYTAPLQPRDSSAPPGSVALAYDASAFVLGYPNVSGEISGVRTFEYNTSTDTFDDLGSVLSGNTDFYLKYGRAVAIGVNSTLGSILAVGVPNGNGNLAGAVQTLALVGNSWIAQDTTSANTGVINGMEYGSALSISNYDSGTAGYYLAVGGPGANIVEVMKIQSGGSFSSYVSTSIGGTGEFGTSVAISNYLDGAMRVVGGAPAGTDGYVRISELDGGSWITQDITISNSDFGASVSISGDGTILAVGDPLNSTVRIYYDNSGTWSLIGGVVLTGQNSTSQFGQAVSVNRDASSSSLIGTIVAIGEPKYSLPTRTECGRVLVMEYLATGWTPVLNSIYGLNEDEEFGQSVMLAPGGEYFVAGGGPDIGRTAVYGTGPLIDD